MGGVLIGVKILNDIESEEDVLKTVTRGKTFASSVVSISLIIKEAGKFILLF